MWDFDITVCCLVNAVVVTEPSVLLSICHYSYKHLINVYVTFRVLYMFTKLHDRWYQIAHLAVTSPSIMVLGRHHFRLLLAGSPSLIFLTGDIIAPFDWRRPSILRRSHMITSVSLCSWLTLTVNHIRYDSDRPVKRLQSVQTPECCDSEPYHRCKEKFSTFIILVTLLYF